jgi:hypothetical protein
VAWATEGLDTSWVAIAANGDYIFALRNDGRVDRSTTGATPNWNSPYSDVGTGNSFVDMAIAIAEYELLILPILLLVIYIFGIHPKTIKNGNIANPTKKKPKRGCNK